MYCYTTVSLGVITYLIYGNICKNKIQELPAPIELTSSTTLDDVIAATIIDNPLADDMNGTPSTSEPDAYLDHAWCSS
jgi:hypothetical protein